MLKEYVFWAGFGAVLLGIVLTLAGNYRRARAREIALEELHQKVLAEAKAAKAAGAAKLRPPSAPAEPTVPPDEVPRAASAGQIAGNDAGPLAGREGGTAAGKPAAAPEVFDATKTRLFVRGDTGAERPTAAMEGIPWLICLGGRQKGLRFSIPALGLSIGRADDNNVIIIDGRVSAHHAWIGMVNGRPTLRDYQSLNGTFLNERLDVAVSEAVLASGDVIQFGGVGSDPYRFVVE